MPHLIEPIKHTPDDLYPVADALQDLQVAHDYLVQQGIVASQMASQIKDIQQWGAVIKRVKVFLPNHNRPKLIPNAIQEHSLIEVINQCATIEHLINALIWADKTLPDYQLVCCHPTTSSQDKKSPTPDNDIVLINHQNQYALFEVFDNITPNPNKKSKSVSSLKKEANKTTNPSRLFIVCGILLWKTKPYRQENHTYIFEI